MIRLFILLPLFSFGLWYLYLRANNWTVKQGMKGFKVILIINSVMIGFFIAMLWLTNSPW